MLQIQVLNGITTTEAIRNLDANRFDVLKGIVTVWRQNSSVRQKIIRDGCIPMTYPSMEAPDISYRLESIDLRHIRFLLTQNMDPVVETGADVLTRRRAREELLQVYSILRAQVAALV